MPLPFLPPVVLSEGVWGWDREKLCRWGNSRQCLVFLWFGEAPWLHTCSRPAHLCSRWLSCLARLGELWCLPASPPPAVLLSKCLPNHAPKALVTVERSSHPTWPVSPLAPRPWGAAHPRKMASNLASRTPATHLTQGRSLPGFLSNQHFYQTSSLQPA